MQLTFTQNDAIYLVNLEVLEDLANQHHLSRNATQNVLHTINLLHSLVYLSNNRHITITTRKTSWANQSGISIQQSLLSTLFVIVRDSSLTLSLQEGPVNLERTIDHETLQHFSYLSILPSRPLEPGSPFGPAVANPVIQILYYRYQQERSEKRRTWFTLLAWHAW